MKLLKFVLCGILIVIAFALSPLATAHASADASCAANPSSGPVGTVFVITCSGFDPNTNVWAYLVEPEGTAVGPHVWGGGGAKTDAGGTVVYPIYSNAPGFIAMAVGTWTIAVEELGPGHSVIHRGIAQFTNTGGTEGVSGAAVWVAPTTVHKLVDNVVVYGSGFAPYEYVTVWIDFANSDCATMTFHTPFGNFIDLGGISTFAIATVKADATGSFAFGIGTIPEDNCEGTYHIVGRGNSSGRSGASPFDVIGNPVIANVTLVASPSVVSAEPGNVISFSGWGFAGGEHVSCWERESNGHVEALPGVRADAGGNIAFSMTTGAVNTFYFGLGPFTNSEGPLGQWWMTCRGDSSGNTGIATFTVVGGIVDP
jgi:hypothetical protein